MDDVPRNPDGTLKKGAVLNPGGITEEAGFQKVGHRTKHFLEKPTEEIIAIINDETALKKLPYRDFLIITTLASGKERTKEGRMNRQEAFDRAYGKSTQIVGGDAENPFTVPIPERFASDEEAAAFYLREIKAR